MTRLSIVMPALNAAGTIGRALDSVLEQAPDGTEVVVADGGSTDGTVDVVRTRTGVRLLLGPDSGLSDAFNKGVAAATGAVIGWLNADDAYLPGALTTALSHLERQPDAEWLVGQCLIVDGEGREIRHAVTAYKNALLRHYSFRLHVTQNFVSAPSTFFRRDAFHAVGGMDTSLRYSMDYDLYLRLGRRGRPVLVPEPLAAFTMAEGTLSMTGFREQFVEHQQVAARHSADCRSAYALNVLSSRAIVVTYDLLARRRSRSRPS